MKMLHLLRHAKSSSSDDLYDRERVLSRRGREAARRLGKHLPAMLGPIDLVLCSCALRTRETMDLVLAGFSPRPRSLIEDELYLAGRERLMRRLRRLDPRDANVIIIGHNPGLHDLAIALADDSSPHSRELASGKFPTGACASFRIMVDWQALGEARHQVIGYVTPETLTGGQD
jgi:phosphohistidine phosphatase